MQAEVSEDYSLVVIATRAINTNDCFAALNGVRLYPGVVLRVVGTVQTLVRGRFIFFGRCLSTTVDLSSSSSAQVSSRSFDLDVNLLVVRISRSSNSYSLSSSTSSSSGYSTV